MALNYIYSDAPLSTIDVTDRCREYVLSVTDRAEEGSVAISNLVIDDPDGDLIITGHRRLYIYEDTAPAGDQMVFNGFVVNERVIRGPSGRTEASRQWVVDLADPNVLINRRIMNGEDANRPAETDLERIQALLTMTELNTVDDDSFVNTTASTVNMDAVDYRGQNVGQYIDDCRQASGKNAYIYYNETLGEYGLWYDFAQSTEYDSGCYLTNTLGENDETTTFLYSRERTYLNVDPSRVASGIWLQYDGGTVYVQDPATTDAFAAIDWAAPSVNVKTLTAATARANRYLADAASEDRIVHTVMTLVPRAKVNVVKKGQLVHFKGAWVPGYEAYTTFRVLFRTVNEISEDPNNSFEIEMDLTPVAETPSDVYWVSFLTQRATSSSGSGIVPRAHTVGCADGLTQVDPWTWLGGGFVQGGPQYPFDVAYQVGTIPYPTQDWGGPGGLNGGARPAGYHLQLAGATGAPVYMDHISNQVPSGTPTAPAVVAPADGRLWCLFVGRLGGDAPCTYTNTTTGATLYDQGDSASGFSPISALLYKDVTTSESVTFSVTATNSPEWGAIVVFVPGDISIFEYQRTVAGGSNLCWTWASLP